MKRANKIGMAIPALEPDIAGKNITAAALLTQRKLARSVRRVCGYLGMTRIRCRALPELQALRVRTDLPGAFDQRLGDD